MCRLLPLDRPRFVTTSGLGRDSVREPCVTPADHRLLGRDAQYDARVRTGRAASRAPPGGHRPRELPGTAMRVTATADAAEFIRAHGAQLFVACRAPVGAADPSRPRGFGEPSPLGARFPPGRGSGLPALPAPRARDTARRTARRASRPPSSAHRGILGRARLHCPVSGAGQRREATPPRPGPCLPAGAWTARRRPGAGTGGRVSRQQPRGAPTADQPGVPIANENRSCPT